MPFIDAKEVDVGRFLSNAQESYQVPLYQRTYSWGSDEWDDLFSDVSTLGERDVHFLGTIVVIPNEEENRFGFSTFYVVDGQQRLATLLIWLSVLRDFALKQGNGALSAHIANTYLFAKEWNSGKEEKKQKLFLSKQDNDAFFSVLSGNAKKRNQSTHHPIYECYNFFSQKKHDETTWQKILNNISLVQINAINSTNAFKLFETLNDRGLELSAADLIKNFLLMRLFEDKQSYEAANIQWSEMYDNVRNYEPVTFIRRFLLSDFRGKIPESRLYEVIKRLFEKEKSEKLLGFVLDLNKASATYRKINEFNFPYPRINEALKNLQLVEVGPSYTLLLKILPLLEQKKISENAVLKILNMIEVFHIRWGLTGQSTWQLDQVYSQMCGQTELMNSDAIVPFVNDALLREQKGKIDDDTFKKAFKSRIFKAFEPRTKYILWRLSEPCKDISFSFSDVQTEHVMPKRLSEDWVTYLMARTAKSRTDVTEIWQDNLDRIGNLTIIRGEWNQNMSNNLFELKKRGYQSSEFSMTRRIAEYTDWTFSEIDSLCEEYATRAVEVWKWPSIKDGF